MSERKRRIRPIRPGTEGAVLVRTTGEFRHVTVYPHTRNGDVRDISTPSTDFDLGEADVLIKAMGWERINEYKELEVNVFVARVVRQ